MNIKGYYTGCVNSGNMGDDILFPIFISSLSKAIEKKYGVKPTVWNRQIYCKNLGNWYKRSLFAVMGGGSVVHPEEISYTAPIGNFQNYDRISLVFGTGISDSNNFKIINETQHQDGYRDGYLSNDQYGDSISIAGYPDLYFPLNETMKFNLDTVHNCNYGGLRGPLDVKIAKSYFPYFNKNFIYDAGLTAASHIPKSNLILPVPTNEKIVGINLAQVSGSNKISIGDETNIKFNRRMIEIVSKFCQFVIDNGYVIFFYPMSRGELDMHLEILNKIKNGTHLVGRKIFYMNTALSNQDMMKLISSFRIAVATRLHANVLANSLSIPTINLMYNYKSINYQESIGMRKYGITTNQKLSSSNIIDKFIQIENNYDLIKKQLNTHIKKANALHAYHIDKLLAKMNVPLNGKITINYCAYNGTIGLIEIKDEKSTKKI
jgi:hypothetical protein